MNAKQRLKNIIKQEVKRVIKESPDSGSIYDSERESYDRMEGLAHTANLARFKSSFPILASAWKDEGFELEDVLAYVEYYLTQERNIF